MKRRQFINYSGIILGSLGLSFNKPSYALSQLGSRPQILSGISSGDAHQDGAIIWSRCDRPAKMWVEVSASKNFKTSHVFSGANAMQDHDYNAKTVLHGLAPGEQWFYRVKFESLKDPGLMGEIQQGEFRTAESLDSPAKRNIRFCWSGDTAGQGYGIDSNHGGMRSYHEILKRRADFFIHCGDLIYADGPISSSIKLPNGDTWKNLITEGTSKVAETTQEFRDNFYYNFLDPQVQALHRSLNVYQQWDDHEVVNNWYPGEQLLDDDRYKVKSVSLLAERSRAALLQCNPIAVNPLDERQLYRKVNHGPMLDVFFLDMRSYRGPNSRNRQTKASPETALLGDPQLQWLKQSLAQSKATWKIISSDMPIGMMVTEWQSDIAENAANGDGPALGRELEVAELLAFIAKNNIPNVHFITADVHYCASHHYQPKLAQFKNFKPFWEFVSGPLHAGTFGPNKLDNTFGPQLVFKGIPDDLAPNSAPSENYQFFGEININAQDESMSVSHFNRLGERLWHKVFSPEKADG